MTVNQEVYRDVLNEGYVLHWYEVKSVLGRGAFGVTYLARDNNLNQLVAIKEYFPHDFSSRDTGYTVHPTTGENRELYEWGLSRFIREAQTLAKFKHHNIVRVMSVFELNNTAYMVMEYEQGEELSKLYKRKERLSEQELLDIFLPILDGLKLVHDAGFIHRDIKPANIYIREDGSPVLIDFGAARKTVGTPTRALTSLVTVGYAPFEQYNESDEKQGAWTDIYALGACLYLAVIGKRPFDAMARGSSLLSSGVDPYEPVSVAKEGGQYSPGFLRAIDHALMFRAQDRPQDVLVWADMLSGKIEVPPLPKELFKQPSRVSDGDATVILTTPPSVPPPVQSPGGVAPHDEPPVTTPGPETMRPESRWKVKVTVLVLFVLSILGGGTIVVFWEDSGPPDEVEKSAEQENQHQLASLLVSADEARKAGKLLEAEDGAIYLYQRVLNIDPANQEAANRIQEIIKLYADGIRSDLAEGFHEEAQNKVRLLQAAVPDSTLVLELLKEVRTAKANQQDISQLLQQAEADFKAGRLNSPKNQNALLRYRRILSISPGNPDAKHGIEAILAHYITIAKKNLAMGDAVNVERNINDILSVDPDSAEVKTLRDKLQTLKTQHQKVTQLLSQAQRAFDAGNIINPPNKSALILYQRVLKLDANNTEAMQGIQNVESILKSLFEKHLLAANFSSAESVMRKIEKAMPSSRLARDIRAEWERSKPASRPDMEVISEIIGKFKQGFESRDVKALKSVSEFQANRQAFLQQFFNNYTSFKLDISDIKFIGRERKGTANIAIMDLINIHGASVEPGTWSRFEIVIRRNTTGQWKVFW
jgi:serine/threonine protein kinase/tetratricopeptide (TPR) repeat protein